MATTEAEEAELGPVDGPMPVRISPRIPRISIFIGLRICNLNLSSPRPRRNNSPLPLIPLFLIFYINLSPESDDFERFLIQKQAQGYMPGYDPQYAYAYYGQQQGMPQPQMYMPQ